MTTYWMSVEAQIDADLLRVKFGELAQNNVIVVDAIARLEELVLCGELRGGKLLRINGPMSIPVAVAVAHRVSHLYGAIAVYDPKLGYVVAVSHDPNYPVGTILTEGVSKPAL